MVGDGRRGVQRRDSGVGVVSIGSLRILLSTLQASPTLTALGASIVFGDEREGEYAVAMPYIVLQPVGGPWVPGYYQNADADQDAMWMTSEQIDLLLYAKSSLALPKQVDHYEAVEDLRAATLQALQGQSALGLRFIPTNGRWSMNEQGKTNAYSRAYVLSVTVDISVPGVAPVDAPTPLTVTINSTI
jgi:hypothetical protein